ncbi:hypothetical protein ACTGJ9_008395 [Bradyrhizobium sp. RDM12]
MVLFANPAAEEIFGRQAESLIGRPIGIPFIAGDTAEIAIHKPDGDQIDAEIQSSKRLGTVSLLALPAFEMSRPARQPKNV